MKTFFILILLFPMTQSLNIFDFNKSSNLSNWYVMDDGVMGGRSAGSFKVNEDGHGLFKGYVSLENNGGFSSIRYRLSKTNIAKYSKFVIRLKGDGKNYQFRAKSSANEYQSYITEMTTNGEWQTIEIPIDDLYPSFRGRKLNMPNFPGKNLEEIAILIANKKAESFELLIDKIELK